jgi:hypothetical protein
MASNGGPTTTPDSYKYKVFSPTFASGTARVFDPSRPLYPEDSLYACPAA